jgi:hypothetical protein
MRVLVWAALGLVFAGIMGAVAREIRNVFRHDEES